VLALATMVAGCSLVRRPAVRHPAGHEGRLVCGVARATGPACLDAPGPRIALGRGLSIRGRLTRHGALALSAGSGPNREVPEVRVTLGFVYAF
jgi:hypothetical protein